MRHLSAWGAGDEEPLVDARVDRSWVLVFVGLDVKRAWVNALLGVRDGNVCAMIISTKCDMLETIGMLTG